MCVCVCGVLLLHTASSFLPEFRHFSAAVFVSHNKRHSRKCSQRFSDVSASDEHLAAARCPQHPHSYSTLDERQPWDEVDLRRMIHVLFLFFVKKMFSHPAITVTPIILVTSGFSVAHAPNRPLKWGTTSGGFPQRTTTARGTVIVTVCVNINLKEI